MSRWTPDRSAILSLLLEEVTGTQEAIHVRQDICRIQDFLRSMTAPSRVKFDVYFTGSKAEGIDLPGSDFDYMSDENDMFRIKVIQSLPSPPDESTHGLFYLSTENTHPGFGLMRAVDTRTLRKIEPIILSAIQRMDGHTYLSSDLFVQTLQNFGKNMGIFKTMGIIEKRQGPSIETWEGEEDKSESGTDQVHCLHCEFWPNVALEWTQRQRPFGWPSTRDVSSIVNFGCHVVPIGYPNSELKLMEWRISFSVAERTLVWSFNHVQMQCYAVMKLILKEFIKKRCSSENQVLCSYFVKTFLFWKYEETDLNFWREDNFRTCLNYLITEFYQCLDKGEIRHYFIPKFNLLSVKLTREAQTELLQLYDQIIQYDISIMKECTTLQMVWSKFLDADENQLCVIHTAKRNNFIKTDGIIINEIMPLYSAGLTNLSQGVSNGIKSLFGNAMFQQFQHLIPQGKSLDQIISQFQTFPAKTCLKTLLIKRFHFEKFFRSSVVLNPGNKEIYRLHTLAYDESSSLDISTCKLWYAIVLAMKKDYAAALSIVEQVLSSIPPFVLFESAAYSLVTDAKQLYADRYLDSKLGTVERATRAWMFELKFDRNNCERFPLAIQIELYFCETYYVNCVYISPFICLYYLMFLCYHELRLYENRDRALRELVDITYTDQCGRRVHHSYNIAGHCLVVAGERERAHEMFRRSQECVFLYPNAKYSSASWYLQNFC